MVSIISVIVTIMMGIIAYGNGVKRLMEGSQLVLGLFCTSLCTSLFFIVVAFVNMFLILRTKHIYGIENPVELQEQVENTVQKKTKGDLKFQYHLALNILIEKINCEIEAIDEILEKNRCYYKRCRVASMVSLVSSFLTLVLINNNLISQKSMVLIMLVFVGISDLLFLVKIIFFC